MRNTKNKLLLVTSVLSTFVSLIAFVLVSIDTQQITSESTVGHPATGQSVSASQAVTLLTNKLNTLSNQVSTLSQTVSHLSSTATPTITSPPSTSIAPTSTPTTSTPTASTSTTSTSQPSLSSTTDGLVYVTVPALNFRTAPSLSGSLITVLPQGYSLTNLQTKQQADGYTWLHVKNYQGQTGWVAITYIQGQTS